MGLKLKSTKNTIAMAQNVDKIVFNGNDPILVSGVYYIPTISEEGILTWVATGADMPVVEPFNVVGPKGEPGVYIGSTPGANDKVWLEPDAVVTVPYTTKEEVDNAIEEAINSIVVVDEVSY